MFFVRLSFDICIRIGNLDENFHIFLCLYLVAYLFFYHTKVIKAL